MPDKRLLTLPEPDAVEQDHSDRLLDRIKAAIDSGEGFLPFDQYMQMALYEPGLGYYVAGARKFGEDGDFVTAPEISPLFSRCLASQCAQVLETFERPACVLEIGAGSGVMAADMLSELEALDALPDHYYILELSADLRERQREIITCRVPHLAQSVKWLDALPANGFHGVVVANEVLDAMPVSVFSYEESGIDELGVGYDDGGLVWKARQAPDALAEEVSRLKQDIQADWVDGYRSELNPFLRGWMQSLADSLSQAAVLLVDYGYPRAEYYHSERREGTLVSFYRHRMLDDALRLPGLQDITASVDFTAVAEAGVDAGLELQGYTTQAYFLMANGLEQKCQQELNGADEKKRLLLSQQVKQLTLPSEMGERFQVIGFSKNLDLHLQGFALQSLTHKL